MASIYLRNLSDELHRKIKRIQLDLEDKGVKKSLDEIYIDLIEKGLEAYKIKSQTK